VERRERWNLGNGVREDGKLERCLRWGDDVCATGKVKVTGQGLEWK
jgi:hypothetical protein